MNGWNLATVISQFLFYLSLVGSLGSAINFYLFRAYNIVYPWTRIVPLACLLGILATSAFFLFKVGAITERGIAGIFDETLFPILLHSNVGYAVALRLLGFATIALASVGMKTAARSRFALSVFFSLVGGLLIAMSFTVSGHVAELGWSKKLAIIVHIVAVSFWLGALLPLVYACRALSPDHLRELLEAFSRRAIFIVVLLIAAGAWLLYQLLPSLAALFDSSYGLTLLAKICAVAGMLVLAARNKLYWTARISAGESHDGLRRSIQFEIGLGIAVLALTAIFANVLGPNH